MTKSDIKVYPLKVEEDKKQWEKEFDEIFAFNNTREDEFWKWENDVKQFIAKQINQAKQEEKKKALEILDQAEDENWFDMPDTTENWKTWKRIRNTINDS
jgi:hypothetical protein